MQNKLDLLLFSSPWPSKDDTVLCAMYGVASRDLRTARRNNGDGVPPAPRVSIVDAAPLSKVDFRVNNTLHAVRKADATQLRRTGRHKSEGGARACNDFAELAFCASECADDAQPVTEAQCARLLTTWISISCGNRRTMPM